jgi:hypothetical protein
LEKLRKIQGGHLVSCRDRDRLLADYSRLGKELHIIREDALHVKHWLENPKPAGWLLIYDNAFKYGGDDGIGDLFPTKEGKILVTTRYLKGWSQESIKVDVFTPVEASDYIEKALGNKVLDIDQVIALAKTLSYLPLALAQACAYIKHTEINISGYLELQGVKQ